MCSERPFHRFITQPTLAPGLRTITRQEAVQNMTSKYTYNNDDNNNNINTMIMIIMMKITTDHIFPNHIHQKFFARTTYYEFTDVLKLE